MKPLTDKERSDLAKLIQNRRDRGKLTYSDQLAEKVLAALGDAEAELRIVRKQRDSLVRFAEQGIGILFESGCDWPGDDLEEKALEHELIYAEPYDPEGKHQGVSADVEEGDTLLQHTHWFKDALKEAQS